MFSPRSCRLAVLTLATMASPMAAQRSTTRMSAAAHAYLSASLDTLQGIVLGRDTIPWERVRDSTFAIAAGAVKPSDTYAAIAWALHRVNKHSFLQVARPGAVSEVVDGRFGYVHVPQWSSGSASLADSLQTALRVLDSVDVCGWIVDVRANGGGNMWPMLAGIGPLLGDTLVGAFGTGGGADRWFYKDGVSGVLHPDGKLEVVSRAAMPPVHLRDPRAAVAVLIDSGTGSSGEVVALAFRGRPNTRSFGQPSAGYATENRGATLADGANMVVTVGYQVDRLGVAGGERIHPDEVLMDGAPSGWPFATDRVATAAAAWLSRTAACRR
jgi:carboxyl-terminal processing protease